MADSGVVNGVATGRFKRALYKGKYYLPNRTTAEFMKELEDFECRDDDVFIVTYPKSGTNWMQEIVRQILLNSGVDERPSNKRFSSIELADVSARSSVSERGPVLRRMKDVSSPRVMATHVHRDLLPKQLREKRCKVIYVYRHPKDVIVSYFSFYQKLTGTNLDTPNDFNDFFDAIISGTYSYGSWFDHVLCYSEHISDDNFLFVSYESMKEDLRKVIGKVASFIGRELSNAAIERVVQAVSLESMRKAYHEEHMEQDEKGTGVIDKTICINKGRIGQWRELFTDDQNQRFDKLFHEKMRNCELTEAYMMS